MSSHRNTAAEHAPWLGRKNGYVHPASLRSGTEKANHAVSLQNGSSFVGGWNSSSGWLTIVSFSEHASK